LFVDSYILLQKQRKASNRFVAHGWPACFRPVANGHISCTYDLCIARTKGR